MASAKLEALKKKHQQAAARIRVLEAKEAVEKRKNETRRKILVGAYVLSKYQKAEKLDTLIAELDTFLIQKDARALFGLAPLEIEDNNVHLQGITNDEHAGDR